MGMIVYRTAEVLAKRSSNPELSGGFLEENFAKLKEAEKLELENRERRARYKQLQERYGDKYTLLTRNVEAGLEARELRAELAVIEDNVKKFGFDSAEDMLVYNAEALRKLKEEVYEVSL